MPDKQALIVGYGNPSRGDDAIGPVFLERLEAQRDADADLDVFDTLTDFQLQIEHAVDIHGYRQVVFVDAAVDLDRPFRFSLLHPSRDDSLSTHALNPAAVLSVYEEFFRQAPPESYLLSIHGERFDLGEGLSEAARHALDDALAFLKDHLMQSMLPI